ncbi:MAG: type I-C CRISPR-associated protein Cas8c/Csd1 [Syntrophales bacterium]|jgi:CRISPR-associated protein Csd1|nr:type I-C CRISPR-associated protein Cas8c/Csd1 [Syntrophales bacterium]MDY0043545.1 type I-C CRISPR-associated protein Cas8c/Csd1 [Syntrophales bacterium]
MLNRLIKYADDHGIKGEQGFSTKRIRWLIQFNPAGEFIGVYDYGKSGREFLNVPHLQFEGDTPMRQFLVEQLEFLLLYKSSEQDDEYQIIVSQFESHLDFMFEKLCDAGECDEIKGNLELIRDAIIKNECLKLREEGLLKSCSALIKKQEGKYPFLSEIQKDLSKIAKNETFKRIGKHQFCLRLLENASVVDEVFGKIANSLKDDVVRQQIINEFDSAKYKAKPENNATVTIIDNDSTRILVKDSIWHEWWKEKTKELTGDRAVNPMRCFLSGEFRPPRLKHAKIKGLGQVGGTGEVTLIAYDKDSFSSYGFSQSENAAICSEKVEQYSAALNGLLSHHHYQLAGSEIVYWYTKDIPPNDDVLKGALEGIGGFVEGEDAQRENTEYKEAVANIKAMRFLKSIANGERPEFMGIEYCAMSLVGNQGRAVVQNWMEGSFTELAQHVEEWFSDLEIVRLSGKGPANFPRMEMIITCLLKEKKQKTKYIDWVKPVSGFREALWNAAVRGRNHSFPAIIIKQVLLRFRESVLNEEFAEALAEKGQKRDMRRARLYTRMGLLKSFLIRNHDKNEMEVTMGLNPDSKSGVYQFGRLFAVLADLQRRAQENEVKSTIVDRFYSTASTSPKLVHGRLISLSNYHLRKLERSKPGTAVAIRNEMASIHEKIDLDDVDDLLNMSEQSYFALGYYQQIAEMNRRVSEWIERGKNKKEKEEENAHE